MAATALVAWLPETGAAIEAAWPQTDPVVTASIAVAIFGFAGSILLVAGKQKTMESGVARSGRSQREWDAGTTTASPWTLLDEQKTLRSSIIRSNSAQAQRLQRSVVRGAATVGLAVVDVPLRPGIQLDEAVGAARSRYRQLLRVRPRTRWDQARQVAYLVDLTSSSPTPQQLLEIAESLTVWREVWPARIVILMLPQDAPLRVPGYVNIAFEASEQVDAGRDRNFLLGPSADSEFRSPIVLAFALSIVAALSIGPLVFGASPLAATALGAIVLVLVCAVILAFCWVLWPPSDFGNGTKRLGLAVGILALALYLPKLLTTSTPTPPLAELYIDLGQMSVVVGFLLLAFRRRPFRGSVRRPNALFCLAVLLTVWFIVAADPMVLGVALIGSFLATSSRFASLAEPFVLLSVVVIMSIDIVGLYVSQNGWVSPWAIIGPAAIITTAVLLTLGNAPQLSPESPRLLRGLPAAASLGWLVVWGVAPIPILVSMATFGGSLEDHAESPPWSLIISACVASLGMGAYIWWARRGQDPGSRIIRVLRSLPAIVGVAAVFGQPFMESPLPTGVLPILGALLAVPIIAKAGRARIESQPGRGWQRALRDPFQVALTVLAILAVYGVLAIIYLSSAASADPQVVAFALEEFARDYQVEQVAINLLLLASGATLALAFIRGRERVTIRQGDRAGTRSGSWQSAPQEVVRDHAPKATRISGLEGFAPSKIHAAAALALGLLATLTMEGWGDDVLRLTPLLLFEGDAVRVAFRCLCIWILIITWLWRHGRSDWLAFVAILGAGCLAGLGDSLWSGTGFAIVLILLFLGGPTTMLAPRRSSRWVELVVCGLVAVLGGMLIRADDWLSWGPLDDVPSELMSVALPMLLAVPFLIVRADAGSSLSLRIDVLKRATRRVGIVAALFFGGAGVLATIASTETLQTLYEAGLISERPAPIDPVSVLWWAYIGLLVAGAAIGWMYLGLLVRNQSWRRLPGLAGLRQELSDEYAEADRAVAGTMKCVADAGT